MARQLLAGGGNANLISALQVSQKSTLKRYLKLSNVGLAVSLTTGRSAGSPIHQAQGPLKPLLSQGHLEGMIGKPSGYIESLPKALRNRLAYLGELQDQHDDLAEKHHEEQVALQRKYEKLWGEHSQNPPFRRINCGFVKL